MKKLAEFLIVHINLRRAFSGSHLRMTAATYRKTIYLPPLGFSVLSVLPQVSADCCKQNCAISTLEIHPVVAKVGGTHKRHQKRQRHTRQYP